VSRGIVAQKQRKAAKQREEERSSGLGPFYWILGAVALVGVLALVFQLRGGDAPATQPVQVTLSPAELAEVEGIAVGDPTAPVTIMEFADFECPACGDFAALFNPVVKERWVETGEARFVRYDFPLVQIHPNGFLAARAARCAGEQDRYWEYHDALYGRQSEWRRQDGATRLFIDLAAQVGMDRAGFERCLRSDRWAEEVTENMQLGASMNVPGTPTFFVNNMPVEMGRTLGDALEGMEAAIERARGEVGPTPADPGATDADTVEAP
jgi:protein-disulfide isomerase